MQGLTTPEGELVCLGAARVGFAHDLTGARTDGIVNAAADVEIAAGSGLPGRRRHRPHLDQAPHGQGVNGWGEKVNSALAKLRAVVERPYAELKRWPVLGRPRISLNRAIDVLHALFAITRRRSSLARGLPRLSSGAELPLLSFK
ncbi:transposase family protein [Streptomyces luteireticuli]|uniref:DDE Tnp4 domain-containing protein n=1 Tax=Streptomyces luteireticuli TaxID=173858 RepID=A0ABN0YUB5_9ACTN